MAYKCKNCGFVFEDGKVKMMQGVKHPDAYYNPGNPFPHTPHTKICCPKCDSDALEDLEDKEGEAF